MTYRNFKLNKKKVSKPGMMQCWEDKAGTFKLKSRKSTKQRHGKKKILTKNKEFFLF